MKFSLFLISVFIVSTLANEYHHHHNKHRTKHIRRRHGIRYEAQTERTASMCGEHEHHLVCGPERHCDKTCDNLFTPPHCINIKLHPKCYFPRCVCNDGYVRGPDEKCIKPSHCPNTYYEPASMLQEDQPIDMMIEFKPMRLSRINNHKIKRVRKARKQAVRSFDNKI